MKIPPSYPEISVLLSSDIIMKGMYYDSNGTGCSSDGTYPKDYGNR